jgi:prevent-host-death family protein
MNTISITQARNQLPHLVKQIEQDLDQVTITVNGKAKALLISTQEWESHIETLRILSDSDTIKALQASQTELQKGESMTFEEVFGHTVDEA